MSFKYPTYLASKNGRIVVYFISESTGEVHANTTDAKSLQEEIGYKSTIWDMSKFYYNELTNNPMTERLYHKLKKNHGNLFKKYSDSGVI